MIILNVILGITTALFVFFLGLGIIRYASKSKDSEEFSALVASITQSEIENEKKNSGLPPENSWAGYWLRLALDSGWKPASPQTPSRLAIFILLFGILGGFFTVGWLAALIIPIGGIAGLRTFFKVKAGARRKFMESQLPNLISGMRANLAANLTPQQAILSQVDEIPAPLGDELKILRQEVNVNIPLDTALANLSFRVPSREIKFLVSSIKIAIASGVDLDPQLVIIQDIITARARIANHLAAAVASVQPSIIVAAVAIPAGFIFSYYSSETNQAFWLTPFGWAGIAVIAFMYGLGLVVSRRLVKKVEDA
jgi:tight adherence protein B